MSITFPHILGIWVANCQYTVVLLSVFNKEMFADDYSFPSHHFTSSFLVRKSVVINMLIYELQIRFLSS